MTLPDIHTLLPHQPPMVLLDAVTAYGDGWIECSVTPRDGDLFTREGTVPALVAIEYMAQAIGALAGIRNRENGGSPRVGYLIGSRQLALHATELRVGEPLTVRARSVWQEARAGQFECQVLLGSTCIADGSLTVYEPPPEGHA